MTAHSSKCKVCFNEIKPLSHTLYVCHNIDHNYSISFYDNGYLYAEEISIFNINDDTGYLVNVDYEIKKTMLVRLKYKQYSDKVFIDMIFPLDNFDRNTFIDRFEKLMVLF